MYKKIKIILFSFSFLYSQFDLTNFELIWKKSSPRGDTEAFGFEIKGADINQDGYSDLIVGSPEAAWEDSVMGRVYLFFGVPNFDTIPDIIIPNPTPDSSSPGARNRFGSSIAVGDFNGDGYLDLAIGDYYDTTGASVGGSVYLYFGKPGGIEVQPSMMFSEPGGRAYGWSVANAGDVNGDGYDDIIVGAPYTKPDSGAFYIYYGGPDIDNIPDMVVYGKEDGWYLGWDVDGIGDINGDGFDDFIVSALGWPGGIPPAFWGAIFVYYGGNPPDTSYAFMTHGEGDQNYGYKISGVGDFNRGGKPDFFTSAPYWPYGWGSYAPGKLYIYFTEALDSVVDWTAYGDNDSSNLGMGIASGNARSVSFVAGGAPGVYPHWNNNGWSYMANYFGSPDMDNIYDGLAFKSDSGYFAPSFGYTVGVSDIDGDGIDEIFVSNYPDAVSYVFGFKYTGVVPEVKERVSQEAEFLFIGIDGRIYTNFKRDKRFKIFNITGRRIGEIGVKNRGRIGLGSGIYFIKGEGFKKKFLIISGSNPYKN